MVSSGERGRKKNSLQVTLTQKTHIVLVDSSGLWNSSQVGSQGSSQEVGQQDKYYEVTVSKYFHMSWFQTTFLLFTANPPSLLKIKKGNRTDGVRIFLVCLSAGKLIYIYKYPSCQPHKERQTVLFALSQTLSLCWTDSILPLLQDPLLICWAPTKWLTAHEFKQVPSTPQQHSQEQRTQPWAPKTVRSWMHSSLQHGGQNISPTHKDWT